MDGVQVPEKPDSGEGSAPDFERLTSSTKRLGEMIDAHAAKAATHFPAPDSGQLSAALDQIRRASNLLGSLEDRSSDLQSRFDQLSAQSERERRETAARLQLAEAATLQALERARIAEEQLREARDQLREAEEELRGAREIRDRLRQAEEQLRGARETRDQLREAQEQLREAREAREQLREAREQLRQITDAIHDELAPKLRR
jgi:DNA repair exonuclease SbcCD ATPase subunit